ncbi:helix-turn-helix domain-containing protein [Actinosynnema sp. NPDC051121]
MTGSAHLDELGEFLKARRAELNPRAVGLPESDRRRRVTGLRREEVAVLAAISTDYYTRLEQGRITPSTSVLAFWSASCTSTTRSGTTCTSWPDARSADRAGPSTKYSRSCSR